MHIISSPPDFPHFIWSSKSFKILYNVILPWLFISPLAPSMPNTPISSNATLNALTERLASHSRSLHPLIGSNFASSFSPQAVAAAASAYRQPAPPPQLPPLQHFGRHQSIPLPSSETGQTHGGEAERCPAGNEWSERGCHDDARCAGCEDEELEQFTKDMGMIMRREFDCWVEQCW